MTETIPYSKKNLVCTQPMDMFNVWLNCFKNLSVRFYCFHVKNREEHLFLQGDAHYFKYNLLFYLQGYPDGQY